jgi:hypothetical protein
LGTSMVMEYPPIPFFNPTTAALSKPTCGVAEGWGEAVTVTVAVRVTVAVTVAEGAAVCEGACVAVAVATAVCVGTGVAVGGVTPSPLHAANKTRAITLKISFFKSTISFPYGRVSGRWYFSFIAAH